MPGVVLPRAVRAPRNTNDQIIVLVLGVVVFGLFGAELLSRFRLEKLGGLFMILAWYPMLVVHELGHAVVSRLVGFRVSRTVIGVGNPLLRFRLGGTLVEVRTFPISGYVVSAPTSLEQVRLRSALVYLAGPGVELALVMLLGFIVGWDRLLSPGRDVGLMLAQSVCVVALLGAVTNLIPITFDSAPHEGRSSAWTDGLGAVMSFIVPDSFHASRLDAPYRLEALERLEQGDVDGARRVLEAAVETNPDATSLKLMLADVLLEQGDVQRAGQLVEPLVLHDQVAGSFRPQVLALLAAAEREVGGPDALDAAEEHSREALRLAPEEPCVVLTRAAVVFDLGQLHEAARLLEGLGALPNQPVLQDEADCWRVLLAARRRQVKEARELLNALVRRRARGRLLERAQRAVAGLGDVPQDVEYPA